MAKSQKTKPVAANPAEGYQALRERLQQQKQEILSMYKQDLRAGQESADDGTDDIVDRANNAYNRELMFSLSDSERQLLFQVEDALRRIDEGSYGRCSHCGRPIALLRLQAVPWARFCIDCQELAEKGMLSEAEALLSRDSSDPVEALLAAAAGVPGAGEPRPVWLVHGDLVLAEPAAERLAVAIAALAGGGVAVESYRRPPSLSPLLADLRTFSLFVPGKVILAVDTAVLADRGAAAQLIDDAREALPLAAGFDDRGLAPRERLAASRLLQALRLFDVDPEDGPAASAIARLPDWALEGAKGGGKRRRPADELRAGLAALLEGARREGMRGWGSGDLADLADVVRGGLPPGHTLVLAERTVGSGHPILDLLADQGTVAQVSELEAGRGGAWEGLDDLAEELARQTGVRIARDALEELARRTLRRASEGRKGTAGGAGAGARADSTARFAGEYRKLANLAGDGRIGRRLVEESVEDRGEEDVWQLLDAIALGRGHEALDRLRRLLASAEDPMQARLAFFGLFASFCRQLTAIRGIMRVARVPEGDAQYPRFKDRWAPALQGDIQIAGGKYKNPLAGLHPYRLHRAYLAASRLPERLLARLPADVLEAELRLKGDSAEADAALSALVARVASARA